jgi:signal transduction histidine kinase
MYDNAQTGAGNRVSFMVPPVKRGQRCCMLDSFQPPAPSVAHKFAYVPAVAPSKPTDTERAVTSIGRIQAVPTLLKVICDITGMGFAAVASVTSGGWTACAIRDRIQLGLSPGSPLGITTTLSMEVCASHVPMVIDSASTGADRFHSILSRHRIESYICVPIIRTNGQYFGNLFALDSHAVEVSAPRIVSMLEDFAGLIANQLGEQLDHDEDHAALLDEREVNELREQFIAILGHDLRNPLQALLTLCGVMSRRHSDAWSVALIDRMMTSVQRMSLLIDDVLDFARARLGSGIGMEIQSAANIDKSLDEVVRELQDANPERSIIADFSVNQAVRCDVGRIQQLASNLLSNALTHGAPRSPIRFTAVADEIQLMIRVWNDGEPIPPESLDKIFSPFWHLTTSAKRNGLGLGLHICAKIVSAHHGQISVKSCLEGGTEFTALIPCATPCDLDK